jgi:hypothetical protein
MEKTDAQILFARGGNVPTIVTHAHSRYTGKAVRYLSVRAGHAPADYAEAGQISDHIDAHLEELAPNGGEPDDTEPPLV